MAELIHPNFFSISRSSPPNQTYVDFFSNEDRKPVKGVHSWQTGRKFFDYPGGKIVIESRRFNLDSEGEFHNVCRLGGNPIYGVPIYSAREMNDQEIRGVGNFLEGKGIKGPFTMERFL